MKKNRDQARSPDFHWPTIAVCIAANFVGSCEYAIVMPSLYRYLTSLGSESEAFFGLVLGSFSFARLFSVPASGHAADRWSMRATLLVLLAVGMGGNVVYATARGPYAVLAGRMIAGLGSAFGPVVFAYVSRVTAVAERTRFVSILTGSSLIALAAGPALNVALTHTDFRVGPVTVDPYRGVGWLMAVLILLLILAVAVLFREPRRARLDNAVDIEHIIANKNVDTDGLAGDFQSDADPQSNRDQRRALLLPQALPLRARLRRLFASGPVPFCLACVVVAGFGQTAVEGLITVVTEQSFGWGPVANSVMFSVIACEFFVVTVGVALYAKRVADRAMIGTGIVVSLCGLAVTTAMWRIPMPLARFAAPLSIVLLGVPLLQMPARSTYSKCAAPSDQGLAQSVWVLCRAVANMLGPTVAGALLQHAGVNAAIASILAAVACLALFFALRWRRLEDFPAWNSAGPASPLLNRDEEASASGKLGDHEKKNPAAAAAETTPAKHQSSATNERTPLVVKSINQG
jgi:MFS family permease